MKAEMYDLCIERKIFEDDILKITKDDFMKRVCHYFNCSDSFNNQWPECEHRKYHSCEAENLWDAMTAPPTQEE